MAMILELGIQIVLFFQGLGVWLAGPMKLLSLLGNEEFFLLLAPALYWCIDSQAGLRVGLLLMISGCTNTFFKILFHQPRPYWIDPAVKAYGAETSFGLPSGHAQNAAAVWGGLAFSFKKRWIWVTAGALAFLIGLSRIYVGVHFPTDVLVGWLIGALLLWIYLKLEPTIKAWLKPLHPGWQVGIAFTASLVLILLGVIARASLGDWVLPADWAANASAATPEAEPINPTDLTGLVSNSAAFFGLCLGAVLMAQRGGFKPEGKTWQLGLRYLVGIVGILVLWAGLREIFPGGEDWLSLILRYVRYGLVGFWVTGGAPWVFYKLRLAA
jgi:membrane-associated phospholipid phosphatase